MHSRKGADHQRGEGRQPDHAPAHLLTLADGLLKARTATNWREVKRLEGRIFETLGINPERADTFDPKQTAHRLAAAPFGREVVALACFTSGVSFSAFAGNSHGREAFARLERAVELNPCNPEFLRALWTSLRRNRFEGPIKSDRSEVDREFKVVLGALENYLGSGLGLRAINEFRSPRPPRAEEGALLLRHGAWALENYATIAHGRSIELQKRPGAQWEPAIAVESTRLSSNARLAAWGALGLCGAPGSDAETATMNSRRDHPAWSRIEPGHIERARRLFELLSRMEQERKDRQPDQGLLRGYEQAAKRIGVQVGSRSTPTHPSHALTLANYLSRHPLMLPVELPRAAAADRLANSPAPLTPPARPEPLPLTSWPELVQAAEPVVMARLSTEKLGRLAAEVLSLATEELPGTKLVAAASRTSTYLLTASTVSPKDAARLLDEYAARCIADAEQHCSIESFMELLVVTGATTAFRAGRAASLDRISKINLDRRLPELHRTLDDLAELVGCSGSVGPLRRVLEKIKV